MEQPTAQQQGEDVYFDAMKRHRTPQSALIEVSNRLVAAEARLREAEQERDTERGTAELLSSHLASTAEKLHTVEARLRVAEEALRRIQCYPFAVTSDDQTDLRAIKDIAAAALGSVGVGEEG